MPTNNPTQAVQPAVTGDGRGVLIARLRLMAGWLEDNPDVPLTPYSAVHVSFFGGTEAGARELRKAAPGGWRKDTSAADNYITYQHGDSDPQWEVLYQYHVSKEAMACERVQVGSRHVEEHDEPVYEWKCAPDAPDA